MQPAFSMPTSCGPTEAELQDTLEETFQGKWNNGMETTSIHDYNDQDSDEELEKDRDMDEEEIALIEDLETLALSEAFQYHTDDVWSTIDSELAEDPPRPSKQARYLIDQ